MKLKIDWYGLLNMLIGFLIGFLFCFIIVIMINSELN